jgi:hypothetical protein
MSRRSEIQIPYLFIELTRSYDNGRVMFKRYVISYIDRNYPKYKLIKIEGMKALCEMKGSEGLEER